MKNPLSRSFSFFIVAMISVLALSCTFTSTKPKEPTFTVDLDSIAADIRQLIITERVNVFGVETTKNKKISSELTARLMNPINLPNDQEKRNEICKQVAQLLKSRLKYPAGYDTYKVLFVYEKTSGGVTQTNYTGHVYKSTEL